MTPGGPDAGTGPRGAHPDGGDDEPVVDGEVLRRNRALREMLDLARRIVADHRVTGEDEERLRRWLEENEELVGVWPADELIRRLRRIFADGYVDPEEEEALVSFLRDVVGEDASGAPRYSTKIGDPGGDEESDDDEEEAGS